MEEWQGARNPAHPAHKGCNVPEALVDGGAAKPLGSRPQSQIMHCQAALPDRNISKEKVVTFPQSTAPVAHDKGHSKQYLVLLLNDS